MTHNTTIVRVSELVDGAADYIEKYGLHKGWYFKGFDPDDAGYLTVDERAESLVQAGKTPPCCVLGALVMTAAQKGHDRMLWWNVDLHNAFKAAGVSWGEVPEWNDKPSQRKSRVVATLRKAAEFARKENK